MPQTTLTVGTGALQPVTFRGVAVPTTNPGIVSAPAYWTVIEPGTYTYFGSLVLPTGNSGQISWNGTSFNISYKPDVLLATVIPSINLFDKATMFEQNKNWGTTGGQDQSNAGWGRTTKIPVLPSTTYCIRGFGTRADVVAYTSGNVYIQLVTKAGILNGYRFTTPSNCSFIGINLTDSSEWNVIDTFQLEQSSTVSNYISHDPTYRVNSDVFVPIDQVSDLDRAAPSKRVHVITAYPYLYVRTNFSATHDILQRISLANDNGLPNIQSAFKVPKAARVDDENTYTAPYLIHACTDQMPPCQYEELSNIGGAHGAPARIVTVVSHNKTNGDLLSIWSDGTRQYALVEIRSSTKLLFIGTAYTATSGERTISRSFLSSTLTHVSGAAHTESITISSSAQEQKYPVVKNLTVNYKIDGAYFIIEDGKEYFGNVFEIENSHEVVDFTDLTLQYPMVWNDDTADVLNKQNVVLRFMPNSMIQLVTNIHDISGRLVKNHGFIQVQKTTISGDNTRVFWYMPNLLPVTNESETFDFTAVQEMTSPPAGLINITFDDLVDDTKPTERQVQLLATADGTYTVGHIHGYDSGYGSLTPANRLLNGDINPVWYVSDPDKSYPRGFAGRVSTDQIIYGTAYYGYFDPTVNPATTAVYYITRGNKKILYLDFHQSLTKKVIKVPSELFGLAITNIEKSSSVTIHNTDLVNAPGLYVSVTGTYGTATITLE